MREHEGVEREAGAGEREPGGADGPAGQARAERLVAAAHGDARAFAASLLGLGEDERAAVIAAAHELAGNAFVQEALAVMATLPAGAGVVHTVVDPRALRRDPANLAKATGEPPIPEGTRARIVGEKVVGGATYVELVGTGGATLGWTSKGNLDGKQTLGEKYAAARAQYVFRAGGKDVMVYLPPGGLAAPSVNVFMFFHGMGGDYAAKAGVTDGKSDVGHDNAALAADIPGAIAGADNAIGICPAGGANPWNDVKPAQYRAMVEETLAHLGEELGTGPLTVGHVSLAGHSAGGKALGPAAAGIDAAPGLNVSDVTLEDAGYNFDTYQASWNSLREWFCTGDPPKTLRVISKDRAGGTHGVVEKGRQFAQDGLEAFARQRGLALTARPVAGDATVREGGMVLLGGLDVLRDGAVQGHLRIYGMAVADALPGDDRAGQDGAAHWKVRNRSMKAAAAAGPDADAFGEAAEPGPYRVLHSKAPILDAALAPVTGKSIARGALVQVTGHRALGGTAYAEVADHGWVPLAYLEPVAPVEE